MCVCVCVCVCVCTQTNMLHVCCCVRPHLQTIHIPHTMATIAIMVGGAVLNAATFIGGNYLAKYYYKPSPQQKNGELLFIGASTLALGYAAFRFL